MNPSVIHFRNLDDLIDYIDNSFLYELTHIHLDNGESATYFSREEVEKFIQDAINHLNREMPVMEMHYTYSIDAIDRVPEKYLRYIILHVAISALGSVMSDIHNKTKKASDLLPKDAKELLWMKATIAKLCDDYLGALIATLK